MANEITLSFGLQVRKTINVPNDFKADIPFEVLQRSLTGTRKSACTQTVGTTAEALIVSTDMASHGLGFFRNLDATNKVQIGMLSNSTFFPGAELQAGDVAIIPLTTELLYGKAFVAAVELDFLVLER